MEILHSVIVVIKGERFNGVASSKGALRVYVTSCGVTQLVTVSQDADSVYPA